VLSVCGEDWRREREVLLGAARLAPSGPPLGQYPRVVAGTIVGATTTRL